MRKYLLLLALPFLLSGCGFKYVGAKRPEKFNSARLMDPNHSPFNIIRSDTDPNKRTIKSHSCKIILEKPCRVNYWKPAFDCAKQVFVAGKLPNGKEYPVLIDSGFVGAEIILNDLVVKENKLEILYSTAENDKQNISPIKKKTRGGLCFLPLLEIGELTIQNPFCAYIPWHREFQVFGLPVWQDKNLFLGVSIMSRFRYMRFDNTKMELEFSYNQSFHPEESSKWAHYPFVLRDGEGGDGRIMVDIPIAGKICHIYFDTAGAEMVVMPDMWEKLQKRITATAPRQSKFLSYQHGFLPCRKTVAKRLSVGNIELKNAEIVIMPEDTPYLPKDVPGYISIWTFKDTVVVLDFERKLMRVKNREQ